MRVVKMAAKALGVVFAILLVLFFLGETGGFFLVEIPFKLAFGWIWFLKDNLEALQPNWLLIAEGLACVMALGAGGHYFSRWLWREMAPAEGPAWRARWTVAGLGALLLLFVAGIATIGITHQAAWLFTAPGPLLVDSWGVRARMSEVLLSGSSARTVVTEFFERSGRLPDNAAEAGFDAKDVTGRYTKSIGIGRGGVVTIEVADTLVPGGRVIMTPLADGPRLSLKCGSNLQPRDMPASCRDD